MSKTLTQQRWIAERYTYNAGFVAKLGEPLISLLKPKAGERILDLGCGDGALTQKLLDFDVEVLGVDSSNEQIAAAKSKGLNAIVCDGHCLDFDNEFDAVMSNAALHWMSKDPDAVIRGMFNALKPGGRLVAEMGGKGNIDRILDALKTALYEFGVDWREFYSWYFPDQEDYSERLARGGFVVSKIELFPRPTKLPGDIANWLETFAEPFLSSVAETHRPDLLDAIKRVSRPFLFKSERWIIDYMRLRFIAKKPY